MGCGGARQRGGHAPPKSAGVAYRSSPSERAILDYVGEHGIPRGAFLGRRRQSVTEYHYDDTGRLTHSVTTHDPEWSAEDSSDALEWQAERAALWDRGHPIDETSNPDRANVWVTDEVTCWACAARERRAKTAGETRPGTRWRVRDQSKDSVRGLRASEEDHTG